MNYRTLLKLFLAMGAVLNLYSLSTYGYDSYASNSEVDETTLLDPRFPNLIHADYIVDYDLDAKLARVRTRLSFVPGPLYLSIFDLVPQVLSSTYNNEALRWIQKVSPDQSTKYQVIQKQFPNRIVEIEVISKFTQNIKFGSHTLDSRWDMSDWVERGFLERYVPASLEHDLFTSKIRLRVRKNGVYLKVVSFTLVTNADKTEAKDLEYVLHYTRPINSSSPYIHLFSNGLYNVKRSTFESAGNRKINITFYSETSDGNLNWLPQINRAIGRLESLIGPWPQNHAIVRATPGTNWGMEYRGATHTEKYLIFHELAHSYFGRGVLSKNGQSAYIDESMVKYLETLPEDHSEKVDISYLRNRPPYSRKTDTRVYAIGAHYIASLRHKYGWSHSTLDFLRAFYDKFKDIPVSDKEFQNFAADYR